LDRKDAVIGQRDAVGVAAEIVKHGLWGTERLFWRKRPSSFAVRL
jgi:hypothetical protein